MIKQKPFLKIVTGTVKLMNAHIWEPVSIEQSPQLYTATLLIPKSDLRTITAAQLALESALKVGHQSIKGPFMNQARRHQPLHDGDVVTLPSLFNGYCFINAASLTAPQIVNYQVYPITDPAEVGSGCNVRASLTFAPVVSDGVCGVACRLGNIQKAIYSGTFDPADDICFDRFAPDFLRVLSLEDV